MFKKVRNGVKKESDKITRKVEFLLIALIATKYFWQELAYPVSFAIFGYSFNFLLQDLARVLDIMLIAEIAIDMLFFIVCSTIRSFVDLQRRNKEMDEKVNTTLDGWYEKAAEKFAEK